MRLALPLVAAALGLALVPAPVSACDGAMEAAAPTPRKITVAELKQWQDKKVPHTVVDVNGQQTRAKEGVIPGAVLLSSSSRYDARELPPNHNEKLVFYCSNTQCSASEAAAVRAMSSGYTDVNVLPVGITGWKSAGQKTDKVPRS